MALAVWTELIWRKKSGSSSLQSNITRPTRSQTRRTKSSSSDKCPEMSATRLKWERRSKKKGEEAGSRKRKSKRKRKLEAALTKITSHFQAGQTESGRRENVKLHVADGLIWSLFHSQITPNPKYLQFEIWCKNDSIQKHLMTFWGNKHTSFGSVHTVKGQGGR